VPVGVVPVPARASGIKRAARRRSAEHSRGRLQSVNPRDNVTVGLRNGSSEPAPALPPARRAGGGGARPPLGGMAHVRGSEARHAEKQLTCSFFDPLLFQLPLGSICVLPGQMGLRASLELSGLQSRCSSS